VVKSYSNDSIVGNLDVGGTVTATSRVQSPLYMSANQTGSYVNLPGTGAVVGNQTAVGNVVVAVRGMVGQTGDLQQWQDSGANVLTRIALDGKLKSTVSALLPFIGDTTDAGPYLAMGAASITATNRNTASNVPLIAEGMVGQTGDLQQWKTSAGVVARIKATTAQTGTPAAATDLATALTLVNDLRAKLLNLGLIS
jgi:hypothetical protein